jgi:hypothetical protein
MNTVIVTKKGGSVINIYPAFSCMWVAGEIIIQKQGILGGIDSEIIDDSDVLKVEIVTS